MAQRIPISKDDLSFSERQGRVWGDMERDLDRRRREWEDEIERMRKDFFTLKPEDNGRMDALSDRFKMAGGGSGAGGGGGVGANTLQDEARGVVEKDENGRPVFRVRFNVNSYKPEEVSVKIESNKLIVHAKHEEKSDNKSVSREFNREVDVPRDIDPIGLQCSMSTDGILTVEAPLPTPQYGAIKDSGGRGPQYEPIHSSNASSVSSPARNTPPLVIPQQQQQQQMNPPPPPPPTSQQQQQQKHSSTFTTFLSGAPSAPQSQPIKYQNQPIMTPQPQSPPYAPIYEMQPQQQQQASSSLSAAQDSDRKFKVDVDIEDFAPEELSVKTVDKKLVISARREEKLGNRSSTKELNREIHLPDTIDPYAVKAFFSDNGKLIVEAPYLRGLPVSHYGEGYQNPAAGR